MIRAGRVAFINGRVYADRCPECRVRDDHEPGDEACRAMQDLRRFKTEW